MEKPNESDENQFNANSPKNSNWRPGEKVDDLYYFTRHHLTEIAALIVLIIGILLSFSWVFWGGLLVGIVAGIYFSEGIARNVKNFRGLIQREGILRTLIFIGVLLGFFIASPGIFIGAAAAIGVKYMIKG